ncbi:AAA family ATPase [Nakamurella antarctica]|uniref:AAA family ATPase n=1 Tax=Nakamurella antarctica TaxID=1902245 RepID=A0A3G8ZP42_9ACTN|nr:AAA family ATPase [Nakamurella antarctica]AZI58898.1 AAA family ATPase [Nakamurella antarctica]
MTRPEIARLPLNDVIAARDVQPTNVTWLWPGRLPAGKLTMLDGDPGTGKSTLALEICARLSVGGSWPDGGTAPLGASLILTAEDDLADTVVPRLIAARANLDNVHMWTDSPAGGGGGRSVQFPTDLDDLRHRITYVGARLVVVDVLMAYLSDAIDAHKDQSVRLVMRGLTRVAADTGAAMLLLRHPTKTIGSSALHRGGGSVGIIGAARAGLQVVLDPATPETRLLSVTKSSYSKKAVTLKYNLVAHPSGVASVEWLGTDNRSADDIVNPSIFDSREVTATKWLRSYLGGQAGPFDAAPIIKEAAAEGIGEATLRRARLTLKIESRKVQQQWVWSWIDTSKPTGAVLPSTVHEAL